VTITGGTPASARRLVQNQQTPADKALLLNMAQTCLRLAEQIEGRDLNKPE
jgi:hypothetical protein